MVEEKAKEQALFCRQLKLLVSSQLPLVRALSIATESTTDEELKQAIEKIRSEIERGLSLSDAMRLQSDIFSEIAVTLVAIGEETATLGTQLGNLAEGLEEGVVPIGGAKAVEEVRTEFEMERIELTSKVREYVDKMIIDAVKQSASDIHLEPFARDIVIRYRVDGVLHEIKKPPEDIQSAIISRIKMMADMDLSQWRFPQDGRISRTIEAMGNREIDMRVSTVPSQWGEAVTIRILDRQVLHQTHIPDLGFSSDDLELFRSSIQKPHGIIIVSGPTGSGKTTTLHAALRELISPELRILAVEEPVEYDMKGITQIDVNPELGLTFPVGIRHILRQDPDVVMVGETREHETAEMVIHTALTGHLVLTTLHTNDAPSAVTRLMDMGIEPFLISGSLVLVIAQRLIRALCPNCKEPIEPSDATLELLAQNKVDISDKSKMTLFKAIGCSECRNTGMKGRIGIFELLPIDNDIREMMVRGITNDQIRREAIRKGMRPMRGDGMQKAASGITTVDEVLRVT